MRVQTDDDTLVNVTDLTVCFSKRGTIVAPQTREALRAVDRVSLQVIRGETLGLVGESGCGKTTMGRTIVRLLQPSAGSVIFDGKDITTLSGEPLRLLRREFQIIFQDPYASLDRRKKVGSLVSEPLRIHRIGSHAEQREQGAALLRDVGLRADVIDRYPHQLSGGQRQRVGIARALALRPKLLVADEPVSALDVSIQSQIVTLLEKLQDKFNLTYVFISHNLSVVRHISHRVAVMYLGAIVEIGSAESLFGEPRHPYTRALLSAHPIPDPVLERRREQILLPGDPPRLASRPTGCRFHNRCWLRPRLGNPEICVSDEPVLKVVGPNHASACHFADLHEPGRLGQASSALSNP
jgi:oligopeptide/dipeptide ABC transporter ATP-binding protein